MVLFVNCAYPKELWTALPGHLRFLAFATRIIFCTWENINTAYPSTWIQGIVRWTVTGHIIINWVFWEYAIISPGRKFLWVPIIWCQSLNKWYQRFGQSFGRKRTEGKFLSEVQNIYGWNNYFWVIVRGAAQLFPGGIGDSKSLMRYY